MDWAAVSRDERKYWIGCVPTDAETCAAQGGYLRVRPIIHNRTRGKLLGRGDPFVSIVSPLKKSHMQLDRYKGTRPNHQWSKEEMGGTSMDRG